jgi:radical SAM superfamily enzyme YgiQ (UPF0313 family)
MMTDITLVNFVTGLGSGPTVPLGPLYIASVLEQSGCAVDFRDYQLASNKKPLSINTMAGFLHGAKQTVGISCQFNTLPFVLACLERVRRDDPAKTIILGGPGPTSVAENVLRHFPSVDAVVKGEGEQTILDIASGAPDRDIRGIVYRRPDGDVASNPPRERIRDLDTLPFPAYHLAEVSDYSHAGVITARGCPYRCSFCEVAPLWGNKTRERSVANVISEIKLLHDRYGIETIHLNDDTFVLSRTRVEEFCRGIVAEGLDVAWWCLGRIDLVDEGLLSKMAHAGCVGVQYGIESGSENVLKRIGKKWDVSRIVDVVKMSLGVIENVTCTFVWGFPFESMGDFYETVHLMGVLAALGSPIKLLALSPSYLSPLYRDYSHTLRFSEDLVSNLSWGVLGDAAPMRDRKKILGMIRRYPDVFPGFYYFDSPDIEAKHRILSAAGLV